MNKEHEQNAAINETDFSRRVGAQAARKLKAQRSTTKTIWFGLGMSGLVGWSVVVPTLIGAALGHWVDEQYPGSYSWTLMLLLIGLIIGCLNVWHWVNSEYTAMHEDDSNE
jgi:ATP synthase protein I